MKMPCIDFGLLHVDLVEIKRRGDESIMIGSSVRGTGNDRERRGETAGKIIYVPLCCLVQIL
jgi:hypothetical protein